MFQEVKHLVIALHLPPNRLPKREGGQCDVSELTDLSDALAIQNYAPSK